MHRLNFRGTNSLMQKYYAYTNCANEHLLIFTLLNLTQRHQFCCIFFFTRLRHLKSIWLCSTDVLMKNTVFGSTIILAKLNKKKHVEKRDKRRAKSVFFYIKLQKVWTVIQPWHAIHIPTFNQIHSVRMYFTNVAVVFSLAQKKMIEIDHNFWERNPIKNLMESIF